MFGKLSKMVAKVLGVSPRSRRRKAARLVPAVQALEDRRTPAVSVTFVGYGYYYGEIRIEGTEAADVVTVATIGRGNRQSLSVTANGVTSTFANNRTSAGFRIRAIKFNGYGGNDHFVNDTAVNSVADGGAGTDYLYGGFARDTLKGGIGTDYLYGREGDDELSGNSGADFLFGQGGNDTLDGGDDNSADSLMGGIGKDKFQMEGQGTFNSPVLYYFNLDHPLDFNPADDTLFGEDDLILDPGSGTGGSGGFTPPKVLDPAILAATSELTVTSADTNDSGTPRQVRLNARR